MDRARANGIGIVEYNYKQAGEYFAALNKMNPVQKYEYTFREVEIKEPTTEKMSRLKPIQMEELLDE